MSGRGTAEVPGLGARVLFFVGKGGVGKSTSSSLVSLKLARSGKRVLLNSIDPAHNLHDIFRLPLGSRPKEVVPGLEAMETDLEEWVKRYLKDTEADFRDVYKYQEAFNLHRYFRILKYSPGLEEYAVLLALADTLQRFADRDYIVFDTPPTALTLKFLALPKVSLLWLEELAQFRALILKKKEIVARIRRGGKGQGGKQDPILLRIASLVDRYRGLYELLKNQAHTKVFLVLNPDELSLAESRLIRRELSGLEMTIPFVILNKLEGSDGPAAELAREFRDCQLMSLRRVEGTDLTGIARLDQVELPLELDSI